MLRNTESRHYVHGLRSECLILCLQDILYLWPHLMSSFFIGIQSKLNSIECNSYRNRWFFLQCFLTVPKQPLTKVSQNVVFYTKPQYNVNTLQFKPLKISTKEFLFNVVGIQSVTLLNDTSSQALFRVFDDMHRITLSEKQLLTAPFIIERVSTVKKK